MDSVRGTRLVNIAVGPNTLPNNRALQQSIFEKLKGGELQLKKDDVQLLQKHPSDEALQELIALRHQYTVELDDANFQRNGIQKEWTSACQALAETETGIRTAKEELGCLDLKAGAALKVEMEEVEKRITAITSSVEKWENAFGKGDLKFCISSWLEVAFKRILRKACEFYMKISEYSDPDLIAERGNVVGRAIINTVSSLDIHDAWTKAAKIQIKASEGDYQIKTELRLNGIGNLSDEKIKILMADVDELNSSMKAAREALDLLNQIKPFEPKKKNGSHRMTTAMKYLRGLYADSGKAHLKLEKERYEDLNATIKQTTSHLRAALGQIIDNNKRLIDAYECYISCAAKLMETNELLEKLQGQLVPTTHTQTSKKNLLREIEGKIRDLKKELELIDAACNAKAREIEYQKRKPEGAAKDEIENGASEKRQEAINQKIGEFVGKAVELHPDMASRYSAYLPQFKKTLERLAMLYVENNGSLSSGNIELTFPKRAHKEDIEEHNSAYKLVRIGLESSNFYRIMLDCTDPQKPLIIFFGTKDESDLFLKQDSFTQASARAARNGDGKLFEILSQAVEINRKESR